MHKYTFVYLMLLAIVSSKPALTKRIYFNGQQAPKATLNTTLVDALDSELPSIQLDLVISSVDIDELDDGFSRVSVSGLSPIGQAGAPSLYTSGALLAVPAGFEPRITVLGADERRIENVRVEPFQKKFRCDCELDTFAFDAKLYQSSNFFPQNRITIEEVGYLQDLRLVRVAIKPFQMSMGDNALVATPRITAQVDFEPNGEPRKAISLSKPLFDLARKVTANGQTLGDHVSRQATPEVMLVFVADDLKETLKPFIEWKRQSGLTVLVKSLTEAGGTKEKIRAYIQEYYDNAQVKPTFLFFVGDQNSMPPYFESTGSGAAATDYTFALLTGDDEIPDALYGRFIASNEEELKIQMERSIAFEKTPEKKGAWYPHGITIASNEGYNPSDKEYAERVKKSLTDHTYTEVTSYVEGNNAKPAAISNSVNAGLSWIAYFGHGTGTSWASTDGYFSNSHVKKLTNADRLPVIIDVACANADYPGIGLPFGKAWVTQMDEDKHAGAVAFLGGSVNISWHPPAIMSEGIAKYHFEKPVHTVGASVLAGQMFLVEKKGTGKSVIDNIKWYVLFGDPSLMWRTDVPRAYTVKHSVVTEGENTSVTVRAIDTENKPVAGLNVSLTAPSRMAPVAFGKTDDSGSAILTVAGVGSLEPNSVLTLTGYNAETFQVTLQ